MSIYKMIVFENHNYAVYQLPDENVRYHEERMEYINYHVLMKQTKCVEFESATLPNAIAVAQRLNENLQELVAESEFIDEQETEDPATEKEIEAALQELDEINKEIFVKNKDDDPAVH